MSEKIEELKKLLEWCLEQADGYADIEGYELVNKCEELGLIVPVQVSLNDERYREACEEHDTDTLMFPYWSEEAKSVVAEKRRIEGGR